MSSGPLVGTFIYIALGALAMSARIAVVLCSLAPSRAQSQVRDNAAEEGKSTALRHIRNPGDGASARANV
jgi:hypothetical protein